VRIEAQKWLRGDEGDEEKGACITMQAVALGVAFQSSGPERLFNCARSICKLFIPKRSKAASAPVIRVSQVRALICDRIAEDGIELLRGAGLSVEIEPSIDREQLLDKVETYHILVVRSRTQVTREIIEAGRNLRIIARAGVGLDNIDLEAARARGLTVLNAPEAASNAVAELTIGLILAILHRLNSSRPTLGPSLRGKALGVIGLGRIGFLVAQKMKSAFNVKVIAHDPSPAPERLRELQAEAMDLDDLLALSDLASVHVPLTAETRHLINEERIARMKETAILVNTSRGGVVDEGALLEALQGGKLAGAGLDVYESEPPKDSRLVGLPNVVATPHIGAQTIETQSQLSLVIASKILEALKQAEAGNSY